MALTSHATLRDRLLVTLYKRIGGAGPRSEVLQDLDDLYGATWTADDKGPQNSRPWETKWQNRVSFERADMVRDGLLTNRADGIWELAGPGSQAAMALLSAPHAARAAEMSRRDGMWTHLAGAGGPVNVSPGLLNQLRFFRGGRGIYADGDATRGPLGVSGVAVSFLHNGSSYADELSDGGVRYHYPKTVTPGRDQAEIEASRAAYRWGLPVFVITTGTPSSTRTVHRGYIEDFDDSLRVFLVTFTDAPLPPPPPPSSTSGLDALFSLTSNDDAQTTWTKRRNRPNQQRFAFQVMQRYGAVCAACGLAISALLQAAHLRAKKEKGSDHPGNGLPLCANHHIAFDANLWGINPADNSLAARPDGPSLTDMGITRKDLSTLPQLPHPDALLHAWSKWSGGGDSPPKKPSTVQQ
ncbi:hypothetical protein NUM3379_16570 [Kineococcus sp. NUM-3379]